MKVHLVDEVNTLFYVKDEMVIGYFYQIGKDCAKMATGCFRMVKMDIFALIN